MAAINNMIQKYGALDAVFGQAQYAQIPMAVVGIVMKFFQTVISISIGMAAGCIPIVGYNIGAERPDRVRELFGLLLVSEAVVGEVALLIVELMPRQLIAVFGAANESVYYTRFAVKAFRIYLCMTALATVNKGAFIFLQAMGKAVESTALSMVREVVFGVGFALLLPDLLIFQTLVPCVSTIGLLTNLLDPQPFELFLLRLQKNEKGLHHPSCGSCHGTQDFLWHLCRQGYPGHRKRTE